ncbi:Putative auto-transporter adhesin, head GIN domain [Daejeonella rubra]|uniref:Putative auto-transporter adhesin, head GIN domain n=1 Tax=Daejeonella rubra TaxID=990371 RepID=A0A1G9VRK7_9SPHI|nr:head GIN domain-containing protein [Daejeonella rubra]SDM74611.1 Putative auto-transporter adhesin, head GIN domain [Daejeonella rubra]
MKKTLRYFALALLMANTAELATANTLITVVKSKKISSDENRTVSGFSGISSSGSYNVFITMGNKESLRLEGSSDIISQIETTVENGILKIRNKKQMNMRNWNSGGKVNIYIEAKTLHGITLSGSGDIDVRGMVKSTQLTNTISGSGSISQSMDVENFVAVISGSGKINAKGKAENAKITIAGSGDFEGKGLQTTNASTKVSGSGNITISADKSLEALMSGSGNIQYSGNPSLKSTKSGSGSISRY